MFQRLELRQFFIVQKTSGTAELWNGQTFILEFDESFSLPLTMAELQNMLFRKCTRTRMSITIHKCLIYFPPKFPAFHNSAKGPRCVLQRSFADIGQTLTYS